MKYFAYILFFLLIIPTISFAQDDITLDSLFDDSWIIRDDIPVDIIADGIQCEAIAYQNESDFRIAFWSETGEGEATLSYDPLWFTIHGMPTLIDPVTGTEEEIDYSFWDGRIIYTVPAADYPRVIKMYVTSRVLRNRGELTIEDKLKQARTVRWLHPQTDSWSELQDGQVIAQKVIEPIICHAGYDPDSIKQAVIWANDMTISGTFELVECFHNQQHPATQSVVYVGEIEPAGSHIWGGNNYIADFSDFKVEGMYRVRIRLNETNQVSDSNAFEIKEGNWLDLAEMSSGWYYYQRCGTEVPGFHAECHADDAVIRDNGEIVDVSGGWHDAGDYGKWIAGGTVAMVSLGIYQEYLGMGDGTEIPRFLDEAAWEGRYFCKAYWDGTFHPGYTADYEDVCAWLGAPECEPQRLLTEEGSFAARWESPRTCLTAAGLAKMGRMIAPYDPELSEWALSIVDDIYTAHQPLDWSVETLGEDAGTYQYYSNSGLLMIDLEYYKMNGDQFYLEDARTRVRNIIDWENHTQSVRCGFQHVALYEFYKFLPDDPLCDEIRETFDNWASSTYQYANLSPFQHIGGELEDGTVVNLRHNSNSSTTAFAWGMATAALVTGNTDYLDVAEHELQWITGFNPTNVCMMAGIGYGPGCYHHRYCFMDGHADGIVPGGIITGIQAGNDGIFELGDMDTKNWVVIEAPLDYPIMDSDVRGWTYSYKTNEYGMWKNTWFTIAAIQIEEALKLLR